MKQLTCVVTPQTILQFSFSSCVPTYVENNTVLIDGSPNDVVVSHSGYGMTLEDIALNCNITVPGNAVNITWFHNGELEQNHSLSADTVHFPRNSDVSAIAGTYVCAASTSNWEARAQFRILLKCKLNYLSLAFACFLPVAMYVAFPF